MPMRAALFVAGLTAAATAAPPNILYLMSDDMRPQMHSYGHEYMITPNLEKLAASGTVFEKAFCQFAYCAPSRSAFLSGRRPPRSRVLNFNNPFRKTGKDAENWITMPQAFGASEFGYFTTAAGKIYHDSLPDPKSWTYPANHTPWMKCVKGDITDPNGNYCGVTDESVVQWVDEDLIIEAGLKRLQLAQASGKPWFVGIGMHRPHWPSRLPKGFYGTEVYPHNSSGGDPIKPPLNPNVPANVLPGAWMGPNTGEGDYHDPAHGCPTCIVPNGRAIEYRRWYSAAATWSDHVLGQALSALEAMGPSVVNNTIVVWHSDHGYQLGEGNEWSKKTNYDLAVRVPLIIKAPMIPQSAGKRITSVNAELQDMYPTLAELAGLGPLQEGVQGESLVGALKNPDDPPQQLQQKTAYSQIGRCGCGFNKEHKDDQCGDGACVFTPLNQFDYMGYTLRTAEGWRYTAWIKWNDTSLEADWDSVGGRELYDLRNDPGNDFDFIGYNTSLAHEAQYQDLVESLHEDLKTAFISFR